MSFIDDIDSKHVKRGKFGPLDVYPQEEKQKEDELSTDFVRTGFRYHLPELLREYEYQSIGKDQPISTNPNFDNDVVRSLLQIVNKREEAILNSQIETNKKQSVPTKVSQTFRPSLILMTGNQKTKESAYAWFKQLANNEPLIKLAKKIPVFNKRADNLPEILITLYEYQVPISRAVWYLKIMVLACSTNLNEANKKKRQPNIDVSSEWSIPLIRLLKEIYNRLQFYETTNHISHHLPTHHSSLSLESFMNVENLNLILLPVINHSYLNEKKLKCLWNFSTKLMRAMLDQNLLDKQYILESLIDLLEKNHTNSQVQNQQRSLNNNNNNLDNFSVNKLILSTISQNMYHFLQSEILSRRLAYFCCKRISNLFNEFSNQFFDKYIKNQTNQSKPSDPNSQQPQPPEIFNYIIKNEVSLSSIKSLFNKFIQCPQHRDQVILLISIVHAVQLGCMQALIWNKVGDGRTESPYNRSALDFLPCPPSALLYTYDYMGITKKTKQYVRRELEKSELCIKRRSIAVETKWITDKLKPASIGIIQNKILTILDILDKNCFDLSDVNETIELLYNQIFPKLDLIKKKIVKSENIENIKLENDENLEDVNTNDNLNENQFDDEDDLNNDDDLNEANKPLSDKDIICLLCDWATTSKRCGLHRIFYAVFLIKKRQIDLIKQIKEFNQIIKNKINKKLIKNSVRMKKRLKQQFMTESETLADSTNQEKNRKRKLKSIDTEDDNYENDDDDDPEASESVFEPSLSKKIKLEPINYEDESQQQQPSKNQTDTSTKQQLKQIADKIKKNAFQQSNSLLNKKQIINQNIYLSKKQKLFLKQKQIEEKKLYEYPFQKILFEYLDLKSNNMNLKQDLDLNNTNTFNLQFCNLVSLFHMFIQCKIFSHDQFVRDLISRGDCFRNNLNDIKRPINVFMNFKKKQLELKLQQQKQTQQQAQQQNRIQNEPNRNSIEYPMSIDLNQPASMPAYNIPPHTPLQHQKSFTSLNQDNLYSNTPHSVPTPCKSSINQQDSLKSNSQISIKSVNTSKSSMSKLAVYVLNVPLPQTQSYQHERNQRFVILYGFGAKKQEIIEKINHVTKLFLKLFSRKLSIDLNDSTTITSLSSNSSSKRTNNLSHQNKHFNVITNTHVCLNNSELENLNQIQSEYSKMSIYDQYSIINKIIIHLVDLFKGLDQKNYLPKLQYIQFIFDLMESNLNIFNIFLFSIRLLHIGPLIEQYLKNKFINNLSSNNSGSNLNTGTSNNLNSNQNQNNLNTGLNNSTKTYYFEYLSHFYLNIIGVLRLHLISLVLWKDLAVEVFKCLFKLVKYVEKPSKCSSHEKCALMLLNEMYNACGYIKSQFTQFEMIANKIKAEKCFNMAPQLEKTNSNSYNYQMKSDELLTSMITTSDHTIDEIENYITSKNLHYNFVAHVFVYISNLSKDEMLRVANLCAELTSRCNILITFWQNASRALHHRNTEPGKEKAMFNELLNKINIQNPKCKENFKLFLSIMASRHCLILNDLIIMVVKTCVMACPGITNDQSHNFSILEPSASLACHIIQYLFTSSPKPLQYRRTTTDQRMITASFRCICFNTFLLVLKCLFLLSEPKKDTNTNPKLNRNNSKSSQNGKEDRTSENEQLELDQFAASVLQEICEHDWIKERCFHEGDNLLKANQLLEPALGRRAQNLLHIICYPQSHELRKQNEQASTKDFIRNILQNLDIWTLRESLLEFKLMIELEKQKERFLEYAVECLAKTTVDFLIDPEKAPNNTNQNNNLHRSVSQIDTTNQLENDQADSNNEMQVDDSTNNVENMSEAILAETDLNLNLDLDQFGSNEADDEFENLNEFRPSQPVGVWLIAPLITRLSDTCQLKVLEHASKTLQDIGKSFWNAKNKIEKESQAIKNIIAWNQQPFFSLLISCLKNSNNNEQLQQRTLLTSLFNGLSDFINNFSEIKKTPNDILQGKEDKILSEDPRIKQIMMDTLHIRLCLVGSMFDFILKNSNDFVNWGWLFVQLVYSGVVDPDNDQLLFTMIIDMLSVLIHHIITLEPSLDNNKHYQSIIKKISKETKDFSDVPNTKAINHIRKLMPLNRNSYLDIMTVDSSSTTASKTISNLHDKRRAFKFARKEKVSTWELIEGVKNASSLCLSWYGSNKLERKMLRYEYQQKQLMRHKHMNIHKELSYLKEKPDVPSDLIELPEPVIVEPVKKTPELKLDSIKQVLGQNNPNFNDSNNKIQSSPAMNCSVNSQIAGSADIVVLGSSIPMQQQMKQTGDMNMVNQHNQHGQQINMNHHQQGPILAHQPQHPPHHMIQQPQMPPQIQSHSQQIIQPHHPTQLAQNHTQIMNRLQTQMQQNQLMNQQLQQQQQAQQGLQLSNSKQQLNRSLSQTPDKQQKANLVKKQKSTTPRKSNNLKAGNLSAQMMPGTGMINSATGPASSVAVQQQPLGLNQVQGKIIQQSQQTPFGNQQLMNNPQFTSQQQINRPMSVNTNQIVSNQTQPQQSGPRLMQPNQPNQQQNFYQNQSQIQQPPQSLTPQPNNQQAQQPRLIQQTQQPQPQQQPAQQQRIPYSSNMPPGQLNQPNLISQNQQQGQQQRTIVSQPPIMGSNQQKPINFQTQQQQQQQQMNQARLQQQQSGQQNQIFQQNQNQQIFKQTSIQGNNLQQNTSTPDPISLGQNNQVPLLPKQAQSNVGNNNFPNSQTNFNSQQQQQQRISIQAQPSQQQQPQQFNRNSGTPGPNLTLSSQPINASNQINWQQQPQRQTLQRPPPPQQQQPQQQFQQAQYLQKQLSSGPINQQQQQFNQTQHPRMPGPGQQANNQYQNF